LSAHYFPSRKFPKEESEIGKLLADIEYLENYLIQQNAIGIARGMNGLLDWPNIQYKIEDKEI
jgi:hypothetical protein